ncbi:hypothetical protein BA895_00045 [Humibacillus sp. DSM 29435]|uniref:hypothetical protein n=1 Tax=Humibacillus sp. DSM 29435 TaxID=1869167 RepID=UPI0008725B05|nr:hypothetical protein [Humibacillus sp. DSM 29435]OFE18650.1 hypothetical protein BA895_00045 [Humibacillus sp. DSM 29435]
MSETEQPERFLTSLAALELLGTIARAAPVLVCIAEAHWMDRPTLDVMTFIARRLASEPIAILMSMRPESAASLDLSITKVDVGALRDDTAQALLAREHPGLSPLMRGRGPTRLKGTRWRCSSSDRRGR